VNNIFPTLFKNKNTHSLLLQFISALLGFTSFIVLARSFDKNSFGHWVIYITAYGFIDVLRYGLTLQGTVRFLSGADETEKRKICSANWIINVATGLLIALIVFIASLVFRKSIQSSDYHYFFIYYPLLVIASFGSFNAQAVLQATQRFDRMLFLRSFEAGSFLLFLIFNYLWFHFELKAIILVQIFIFACSSIFCSIKKWDGLWCIRFAEKSSILKILNFGKYSTGTLLGAHLLRSADTFILGLSSVLGAPAVAVYSIPMKAIEFIEIPLRAFSLTSYPVLSKLSLENKMDEFRKQFYTYSGALSLLFVPIMILGFIFAKEIMIIIGGKEYESGAIIFRIFTIFGLLTPLDRFTGIALDSLNRPDLNFYKIIFMVTANVIGDLIAVFVFQNLVMVAWVTLAFLIIGAVSGLFFTKSTAKIEFSKILPYGYQFYRYYFKKYLHSNSA